MIAMQRKTLKLDERITFRLTTDERKAMNQAQTPRESEGDFIREAIQREVDRRKKIKKP